MDQQHTSAKELLAAAKIRTFENEDTPIKEFRIPGRFGVIKLYCSFRLHYYELIYSGQLVYGGKQAAKVARKYNELVDRLLREAEEAN